MNIYHKLLFEYEERSEIALLTVTAATGSNPSRVGMYLIIDKSGEVLEGSVGGGSIEEEAKVKAIVQMKMGQSGMIHIDIKGHDEEAMDCVGTVDIFVQVFTQKDEIMLIGAGNVARSIYQIAELLDYEMVIVDDRPQYANVERFPKAKEFIVGDFVDILEDIKISKRTNVIIATHGHDFDLMALKAVARSEAKYVGMLSNRKKAKTILGKLAEDGIEKAYIDKIFTPIGLSVGGTRPAEIAVSIMAEIQAVKYDKMMYFRNEKREIL
jgi:xanthine dehydrogenase accessory factor